MSIPEVAHDCSLVRRRCRHRILSQQLGVVTLQDVIWANWMCCERDIPEVFVRSIFVIGHDPMAGTVLLYSADILRAKPGLKLRSLLNAGRSGGSSMARTPIQRNNQNPESRRI